MKKGLFFCSLPFEPEREDIVKSNRLRSNTMPKLLLVVKLKNGFICNSHYCYYFCYSDEATTPSNQHCPVIRSHWCDLPSCKRQIAAMHTVIIITVVCRPAKSSSKCSAITMCAAFTVFLCCLCQTLQCRVLFTALCYCAVYMQSKDLQANVVCLCVVCRKHLLCTSRFRKWLHFETMRHFARWCGPVRKPNDITARNPDLDDVCI